MKRKNNLDEMQEQKLLHIESKGYWLAFWGLGVSLIIQLIFSGLIVLSFLLKYLV